MRPLILFTPPLLASRRIAGFVMPWINNFSFNVARQDTLPGCYPSTPCGASWLLLCPSLCLPCLFQSWWMLVNCRSNYSSRWWNNVFIDILPNFVFLCCKLTTTCYQGPHATAPQWEWTGRVCMVNQHPDNLHCKIFRSCAVGLWYEDLRLTACWRGKSRSFQQILDFFRTNFGTFQDFYSESSRKITVSQDLGGKSGLF